MTKTAKTTNTVHNNTAFTTAELAALTVIGTTINHWRGRNITLYNHPTDPARVVSVGVTFNGDTTVVCDDARDDWATAIAYAAAGKVYVTH